MQNVCIVVCILHVAVYAQGAHVHLPMGLMGPEIFPWDADTSFQCF